MTDGLTASDVALLSGNGGRNDGFGGGDWGAWIILFLIFGMFGWGGFGGWGGGFGGGGAMQGYATQADIQRGLDTQSILGKLDANAHGICDSTYAITGAVNTLGTTVMQGFSQAELSRCNQQAALMQQLNTMMFNAQQCCCETQRAIDGVNYNMAKNTCDLQNTMNNNTRDILDNQNSNTRAILDWLCQKETADLRAENQALKLAASQSNQNAVLMAAMDANKADILRRTGNDCPVPAYVVQPPAPVTFPTDCCGQFRGGWGNSCGSGCGSC